jgi:hypothetical protein
MDTITRLLQEARDELGDDATPREVAVRLLNLVFLRDDAAEVIFPLILARVSEQSRVRVRDAEKEVYASPSGPYVNPAEDAMRRLLAETCYVVGYGRVPWGDMTPELHRVRIAFLNDQAHRYLRGIQATIARHEAAVALLLENQCTTLNEYAELYGALPGGLGKDSVTEATTA